MRITHEITEGDTDSLVVELREDNGDLYDLTGATVTLSMWRVSTLEVIFEDQACTHDDTGGNVTYAWTAADTDESGEYNLQYKIVLSGGGIRHYPKDYKDFYLQIHSRIESTDTTA